MNELFVNDGAQIPDTVFVVVFAAFVIVFHINILWFSRITEVAAKSSNQVEKE